MITKLNFTDRTIKSYAIRKLTPKECFRLMGVRDNVIGTMQSSNAQAAERLPDWKGKGKPEDMAISASQQYRQAGNSICIDVLAYLYQNLFYPAPPKSRPGKQLTLFDDPEDTLPALPPIADKNEEKIFLTTFSGYDSQLMAARRATRVAPQLPLDVQGMERHRQIRLSDAQPRLSSVCRLRPGRHHQD